MSNEAMLAEVRRLHGRITQTEGLDALNALDKACGRAAQVLTGRAATLAPLGRSRASDWAEWAALARAAAEAADLAGEVRRALDAARRAAEPQR